mgnify:FL=1
MPTVHLFPNPYHHLDHKGRLAGIAFQLEPRAPHRRLIGARISMVDGSYVPDSVERDIESLGVLGHGDVFHFFGDEPVAVQCADEHVGPYQAQAKAGEIFLCDEVPLEGLAAARLDAVAQHVAAYGKAPDTAAWSYQFPIDDIVAQVAEGLAAKREAAEKSATAVTAADPKKALDDRRAALTKRAEALVPQAATSSSETTSGLTETLASTPTTEPVAPERDAGSKRAARKQES